MRTRKSPKLPEQIVAAVQRTSLLDVKLARPTFEIEAVHDFLEITLKISPPLLRPGWTGIAPHGGEPQFYSNATGSRRAYLETRQDGFECFPSNVPGG
jgi:hypothetical protein